MSTDPLPITGPLIAACVAGVHGGLFTCVDAALTSVSDARLRALANQARPSLAASVRRAVRHRETVQARYLTGRIIALSIAVAGYTMWLTTLHESRRFEIGLAATSMLLFGVLVHIAAAAGRHAADWVITFGLTAARPLELLIAPVADVMRAFTRLLPTARRHVDPQITESEVEIMVDQSERAGALEHEPAEMIRNVLEFSDLTAHDAMVPRTRVTAIKLGTPLSTVLRTIIESGHSRYPVYREEIDDTFGLLYAKDLFQVMRTSMRPPPARGPDAADSQGSLPNAVLQDIVRKPAKIVSESQPLSVLLRDMRQERQHLAVVVDEFGDFSGVVTLEDVLEEIVGDIRDEYDHEEAPITELGPDHLVADAAVLLSDLSAYLGSDIDPEGQYDSLGGMLTEKLGSVPTVGTCIPAYGLQFIVRESDTKRVAKVEIVRSDGALTDTSDPHSSA